MLCGYRNSTLGRSYGRVERGGGRDETMTATVSSPDTSAGTTAQPDTAGVYRACTVYTVSQ